jgi:tagaturonate reductase
LAKREFLEWGYRGKARRMKILQFGTGVFIRGYFDWMLQKLAQQTNLNPEVAIVKLTPSGDLENFKKQNGEFHIVVRGLENGEKIDKLQKIDRVKDFLHPYQEWQRFLDSAEDPDFQLVVSNSTEAGLCYEKTDDYMVCPNSFPAKLYAWLKKRFTALGEEGAIAIMAFELIPDNASKLKSILQQLAAEDKASENLLNWLSNSCRYINTLVDRIVSKLPEQESLALQKEFGIEDKLILCAEPYHLLAVDSDELEKILPFKKLGLNVEVSDDLGAIREKKVKVLNGAHMLVVPAGLVLGHEIVLETLENQAIRKFAESCLKEEVAVTVTDPQIDSYIASVIERFENPFLNHRLENIALNSSAKIGQRLFPSIIDFFEESGRFPEKLLIAVAVYLEFYKGDLLEAGTLKTTWGKLQDSSDSMKLLSGLHQKNSKDAATATLELWPVPEKMKKEFISSLSKVIETVRENGVKQSLLGASL